MFVPSNLPITTNKLKLLYRLTATYFLTTKYKLNKTGYIVTNNGNHHSLISLKPLKISFSSTLTRLPSRSST
jgi:hypothetical protein